MKTYSKRERMIFFIIALWIIFGIFGIIVKIELTSLGAYFASLTGFVGAYVWAETKRPSKKNDQDAN